MKLLRRILWVLLFLLVGLGIWVFYGNPESRGIRFALRSYLRGEANEAALEERRTAARPEAEVDAFSGPEPVWTVYQGPRSEGRYTEGALALPWPEAGPRVLWRAPVGRAYSSIVVGRGLALTLEQRRDEEALVAFDLETGGAAWSHAWPARFEEPMSKEGPRSTPVIVGDRVVATGAEGEVRCVALGTGELHWSVDLLEGEGGLNLTYGMAASPVAFGELVIVHGGAVTPGGSVQALDVATGERRWGTFLESVSYSTPLLTEIAGQATLVVLTGAGAVGLDPATGDRLWSTPWEVFSGLSCTQPVALGEGRILLSAGYGKGSSVIAVRRAETDDAGSNDASGFEVTVEWTSPRFKTRYSEPVVVDGLAYGLDEGILSCIELAKGRRQWKEGRYGYGQLVEAQGHLIVQTEDGDLLLFSATAEEPDVMRRSTVLPGGYALNSPALAHGRLLVRNQEELVCIDLRPDSQDG